MIDQFDEAVTQYLDSASPLLSIGEHQVLKSWIEMSTGSKRLYIFLFHRKPKQFRREHIQYVNPEKPHYFSNIDDEEHALGELNRLGFLLECQHLVRTELYLDSLRKPEISKLCKR